ncbi:MAG: hypothetical protein ACKPKQ_03440 [Dolichospermum sp.]
MSHRKIAQVGNSIKVLEIDGTYTVWKIAKIRKFYLDIINNDGNVKSLAINDFNDIINADKIIDYKVYKRRTKLLLKKDDLITAFLDNQEREFVVMRIKTHYIYLMYEGERYRIRKQDLNNNPIAVKFPIGYKPMKKIKIENVQSS